MDSIDFGYRPNLKATNIATTAFRVSILNSPLRDTGPNDMLNRFNDLLNIFFIRYIQLILKILPISWLMTEQFFKLKNHHHDYLPV